MFVFTYSIFINLLSKFNGAISEKKSLAEAAGRCKFWMHNIWKQYIRNFEFPCRKHIKK
jgi:hypothetical protein